MSRLTSFLAVVAGALTVAVLGAQEVDHNARWPQFRGPNALGVAPDGVKFPVHFGPAKNVVWKTPLPRGQSSPCLWDDRIFLTCFDPASRKLETLCLDRQGGKVLWRRTAPAKEIERVHEVSSPAAATPATDGERVYVYFGSFGLLCYDFDGNERWQKPLPLARATFGTASSPVVAGDLVLLNREFRPDPSLMAVHSRTGETAWKQVRKLASLAGPVEGYATPVLWHHDGVDEVLIHSPTRLSAHDLKDGAERWSIRTTSTAINTPVLGDGQLFLAAHLFGTVAGEMEPLPPFDAILKKYDKNGDGKISAEEFPTDLYLFRRLEAAGVPGADLPVKFLFGRIDANRDGQVNRQEWDRFLEGGRDYSRQRQDGLLAIKPGGQGDVSKTHVLWREKRALPEVPSPLYYRGRVYLVRDGGIVSCLDARTGRLLYRERLGAGGAYFSSPVAGDGKVYVGSRRGAMVVFAAGDELKVLARNDFGEAILATPALVDGRIYVRTEKHLYALGE